MRIFLLILLTSIGLQTGVQGSGCHQIECTLIPIERDSIYSDIYPVQMMSEKESLNWSGYAGVTDIHNPTPGSVTAIRGSWVIPTLNPSSNQTYSASWIGIDGLCNGTVEQIGTAQNWVNGHQQNYAWFEMFPSGAYQLNGFPVENGDKITAWINYLGDGVFQMTIQNNTKNFYFTVPTSYTTNPLAQRSSAEWIIEAPSAISGILPLADFGNEHFSDCEAIIGGVRAPIVNDHWECIVILMDSNKKEIKALPSTVYGSDSFNVTWEQQ